MNRNDNVLQSLALYFLWLALIVGVILTFVAINYIRNGDVLNGNSMWTIAYICYGVSSLCFIIWLVCKVSGSANKESIQQQNAKISELQKQIEELKKGK